MTTQLPLVPEASVQATNRHDPAAFLALFATDAVVDQPR